MFLKLLPQHTQKWIKQRFVTIHCLLHILKEGDHCRNINERGVISLAFSIPSLSQLIQRPG